MGLFKSKQEKALDAIIAEINMNMANNYKDNAQENLRDFEELFHRFIEEGTLKEKAQSYYGGQLNTYKERLKGYSHKDQKPFWT